MALPQDASKERSEEEYAATEKKYGMVYKDPRVLRLGYSDSKKYYIISGICYIIPRLFC
jgi:hypothetical protein